MEITMPRASLTIAVVLLVLCTVDSIGGNYLAFPRMGRSDRRIRSTDDDKRKMSWNLPGTFFSPRKRQNVPWGGQHPFTDEYKRKMSWKLPGTFFSPRKRQNVPGGYLAFPRMGRSGNKVGDVSDCCGVGLKSEFLIGQGKDEVHYVCSAVGGVCCDGLREMFAEKPDGVGYSMCIPDVDVVRGTR